MLYDPAVWFVENARFAEQAKGFTRITGAICQNIGMTFSGCATFTTWKHTEKCAKMNLFFLLLPAVVRKTQIGILLNI